MASDKIVRPKLRKIVTLALMASVVLFLLVWFATYFYQEGLKSQDTVLVTKVNGAPIKDDTVDNVVDRVVTTLSKYRLREEPHPLATASETPVSKDPAIADEETTISDSAFAKLNRARQETKK